jgi:hypothetical protein
MSTLQRILILIMRLTGVWLQSVNQHFVAWTKPDTSSLLQGTLTDFARSKSELAAENALLRVPLIILRRQVKRPACTKSDCALLVLLARMVRTWEQALFIVQEDDAPAVASPGLSALLEVQVEGYFSSTRDLPGDCGLDPRDGQGQSPVGIRAHSGRIVETGHPRLQEDHSEVYESCASHHVRMTDVEDLPAQSCHRHLGV